MQKVMVLQKKIKYIKENKRSMYNMIYASQQDIQWNQ